MRTGPYTAVRRVELAQVSQAEDAERVEVGIRQGVGEGRTIRKSPRAMRTTRGLGGEVMSDHAGAEFRKPPVPTLPLLPHYRAQSAPKPLIKILHHRGCLAEAEVAWPTTQVCSEFLHSLLHADPSCPARQFSDPSFEPQDRLRRNAPARFLAAREAEP